MRITKLKYSLDTYTRVNNHKISNFGFFTTKKEAIEQYKYLIKRNSQSLFKITPING